MNLYHLQYFVTLAHLEHYTKSAERLNITQPSLSHAISTLEKEVGVKLFEKEGRNIVLTKYGKTFLKDVEQALNLLDASVSTLQRYGRGEGRIDIAYLRTLSTALVPSLVRGFLDKNPAKQIDFRFHSSTGLSIDMIEGLKTRIYDVAFCSQIEHEPMIEYIPVARQELVLIVPPDHPLAGSDTVDLVETLPYPQVFFSKRSGLRPIIDKLFRKINGSPIIAHEIAEDQAVAGLVAAGFGIAVVPHMQILDLMNLKILHIKEPAWERNFFMAYLKDTYQAPLIEEFKKYVASCKPLMI
ncbi:MAG TPA: LysR family transcriptional regulator [Candidatus Pelethocola excrementipullorum]|nr:LysR family transcriptional regulator [Candidatus Pelethocola excrementipullorum]